MTVSFAATAQERTLVELIAKRVIKQHEELFHHCYEDRESLEMDLLATHANGNPMDFERLLDADPFNLLHDVVGIYRHLDRTTGQLNNCFCPRFSRRGEDG